MATVLALPMVGASASMEVRLTGRVELDHGDQFGIRESVEYTMLDTGTERVRLEGAAASDLRPGTRITARGRRIGYTLTLSDGSGAITLAAGGSGNTILANSAAAANSSALEKRVAVLLVNFVEPTPTPVPPTPTPPPTSPPPTPEPTETPSPTPAGSPAPLMDPPTSAEPTPPVEPSPTVEPSQTVEPSPTVDPSPSTPPPPTPSPTPTPPPPPPPVEPWTKDHVRGVYFTNTRSVASYYTELSAGRMSVRGDVLGYFTLAVTTDSCDYNAWGVAARAAATASGVDLNAYTNVVHVFPKQPACWWMGMANLPGRNSWINGALSLYVTSHELGHNFGVHHAATISCTSGGKRVAYSANCSRDEYGDPYDVMGYTGQRHMSAWHQRQLGFLTSSDVLNIAAHGTYRIGATASIGQSPRVVRLLRPSGDYYYLESRQPFGKFDNFAANAPPVMGVSIRVAADFERSPSKLVDTTPDTNTYLDAPLIVGKTFVDPVNQIYITTLTVGPAGADVLIQVGPDSVPPTTPVDLRASTASGSIALQWTAATDDAVVTGYTVSRDGVPVGTVSGTSFSQSGLAQGRTYTYRVAARDRSNVGPAAEVQVYLPDTTPPAAPSSLIAQSTGPRSVAVSWTDATDNIAVVAYTISRNGFQLGTTSATTFADSAVPDGSASTYEVRAVDAAGNIGAPATTGVSLPDVTVPQFAGVLQLTSTSSSSLTLDWQAAGDNVGIAGYRVFRDGVLLATVAESQYVDEGLAQARTYDYAVIAFDAAGNESAPLTSSTYVPDVLPPTTPTGLTAAMTTSQSASLAWSAAADNIGVDHYVIARDGIEIASTTELASADLAVVEGSTYVFSVSAVDAAGNVGAAITVQLFAPDVTAPQLFEAPTVTASSSTSAAISWIAATDNVGVVAYLVMRDNVLLATVAQPTYEDVDLSQGRSYTYSVVAVDAALNQSQPTTASIFLPDTVAPSGPSSVSAELASSRSVSLSWEAAADNVGVDHYVVTRDGSLLASTVDAYLANVAVDDGRTYEFTIAAVDAAGNVGAIAATWIVVPDVTAPTAAVALTAKASTPTSVVLTWSAAADNVGVTGYVISRDGVEVRSLPGSATSFADTALASDRGYLYSVAALDGAGNVGRSVDANVTLVSVDTASPTTPANVRAQSLGERRISLTWNASTDSRPGAVRYAIYRGTQKIATVTTTSFVDRPATVGQYRYRVRAIDVAGNMSPFSISVYGRAVRSV